MLSAIVGVNWGDEGKGRIVDYLSQDFDIVSRYQGGNNAGHTVVNEKGTFILNLLPSGILRDGTVNVMGTGMVIDIEHLVGEIGRLREKGIEISPENLKSATAQLSACPITGYRTASKRTDSSIKIRLDPPGNRARLCGQIYEKDYSYG